MKTHQYKFLSFFVIWSVTLAIVSNVTAGKTIDLLGIPTPVSIFCFPFIYVISDVLTEVYGYATARTVLWQTTLTSAFAAAFFSFAAAYPSSSASTTHEAYSIVLDTAPQIAIFGLLAVFVGDLTNNYVLAKMKIASQGRLLAVRLVASTLAGQAVNTMVFFAFGLWGILPPTQLVASVVSATLIKTAVEIIALPLTIRIIQKLKKAEGVDFYDTKTDFNPLKL